MHRVQQYGCDAYWHVNYANYLRYMQETAFDASAAAGYDPDRYQKIQRALLVRETDIIYLRPLVYDDLVWRRPALESWLTSTNGYRHPGHAPRMGDFRAIESNLAQSP